MPCFFCDIQINDNNKIVENEFFWCRFSDFPVSEGNCEIFLKEHKVSLWELSEEEWSSLWSILKEVKEKIEKQYSPDAYNFGVNEGEAAGRSISHLHFHLIPRYKGDVPSPRGGIRKVIDNKADYYKKLENDFPERKKYLSK